MDWNWAIELHRGSLKRVLASIAAMIGISTQDEPAMQIGAPQPLAEKPSTTLTLPRYLHRIVARLLLTAESATRRLIITAARDVVVTLPGQRPERPKRVLMTPILRSLGIAVVAPPAQVAAAAQEHTRKPTPARVSLPLFDPPQKIFGPRRPFSLSRSIPRIWFPGAADSPRPPRPSRDDPVDASRLILRLGAVGRALDDLPKQARRFARWDARLQLALAQRSKDEAAQARLRVETEGARGNVDLDTARRRRAQASATGSSRDRRLLCRLSPIRPGRPYAWRRRPDHEVYRTLDDTHGLAFDTLQYRADQRRRRDSS